MSYISHIYYIYIITQRLSVYCNTLCTLVLLFWDSNDINGRHLGIVLWVPEELLIFFQYFVLVFRLDNFHCSVLKSMVLFSSSFSYRNHPMQFLFWSLYFSVPYVLPLSSPLYFLFLYRDLAFHSFQNYLPSLLRACL